MKIDRAIMLNYLADLGWTAQLIQDGTILRVRPPQRRTGDLESILFSVSAAPEGEAREVDLAFDRLSYITEQPREEVEKAVLDFAAPFLRPGVDFETAIGFIEKKVRSAVSSGSYSPLAGPTIIEEAINAVIGSPTTKEQLLLLATVPGIDSVELGEPLETGLGEEPTAGDYIERLLRSVIHRRLGELKRNVAIEGFVTGFLPAVDELLLLAEAAGGKSRWVSVESNEEVRDAFNHITARAGSGEDLDTLFSSPGLLQGLLMAPTDEYSWAAAGIEKETAQNATNTVQRYISMLYAALREDEQGAELLQQLLDGMTSRLSTSSRPPV